MLQISNETRLMCGLALISVPTVQYGGSFLLKMLRTGEGGYVDNPIRQNLFRAGHAHAGVILMLALICQVLVDSISISGVLAWSVRIGVPATAILMPLGFFLSVGPSDSRRPSGAIRLVYLGAVILAVSVLILGVGLVRAAVS